MPYSIAEIRQTLRLLDKHTADELETDTLEFKECGSEQKLREQALAQEGQVYLHGHGAGARWHAGPKR